MISDILADAVADIRSYQADSEWMYAGLAEAINSVCEVMGAMQHYLDTAPAPPLMESFDRLRVAIGQLDLSAVQAARQGLIEEWRKASRRHQCSHSEK